MKKWKIPLLGLGMILACGVCMLGVFVVTGEAQKTLSGLLIGVGAGVFGACFANLVTALVQAKSPQYAKRVEIEKTDERNQRINTLAKAKAYDAMVTLFGLLMISFVLMGESLRAVLFMVGAYLLVTAIHIFYVSRFSKML